MGLKELIAVARGDAPADLLFVNARVVNTLTGEIEETNVALFGGRIAGVGDYTEATRVIDLQGRYLAPGLIDGHCHVESSYLRPDQYARAVVPHGTLGVVTDLHEIANVGGLRGVLYILSSSRRLPLDLFLMAPSCVPATTLETSGTRLSSEEIRWLLRRRNVLGLGEVMDFPSVIRGGDLVLSKIRTAGQRVRDGHAPGLGGKTLNAYLAPLIASDHEATGYQEGLEKLRRGMHLMIREGSVEKNLEALLPLVTDNTYHRCMLVVDDRNAKDLFYEGDVDALVRKAIGLGLDPVRAIQLATINPATYFRLEGLGAIAPGYWANLLVLDDLKELAIASVYYRGRLVAQEGRPLFRPRPPGDGSLLGAMYIKPFTVEDLALSVEANGVDPRSFPVIEIVPGQIITRWATEQVDTADGLVVSNPERDLLKLVVVERHRSTGNIGKGLVKGFGLKKGALATSVAHDSHNIVAVGARDEDIYDAVKAVEANQGGLASTADGEVMASLPLPIAGLLCHAPLEEVVKKIEALEDAARGLGCALPSPFSILSFLALPVIPELKLTDMGLVDPAKGEFVGKRR